MSQHGLGGGHIVQGRNPQQVTSSVNGRVSIPVLQGRQGPRVHSQSLREGGLGLAAADAVQVVDGSGLLRHGEIVENDSGGTVAVVTGRGIALGGRTGR